MTAVIVSGILILMVVGIGFWKFSSILVSIQKVQAEQIKEQFHKKDYLEFGLATLQADQVKLKSVIETMPQKVLHTIQGSSNNLRGSLGELISYMKLRSAYDKVITLDDVIDFIGIRYGKDGIEGTIDFIEVKTGNSKLSKDQREVRQLVKDKKVRFCKLKVDVDENSSIDEG